MLKIILNKYNKLKSNILLFLNRYRSLFGIKWENKIPRIIVHEKYEKHVKYSCRIIIFISILSSVLSLPVWYLSLSLAIFLFLIGWFFEKAVFRFTTIFITPMADFKYDPSEWNGMGYIYAPNDINLHSYFGPAFKSKEYGINIHRLISSWNFNKIEDNNGNICISFIEEKDNHYRVFIYPSLERETIKEFEDQIKKSDKYKNKDHHHLVVQMVLCHEFPLNENSNYSKWKELYLKGQPACLTVFIYDNSTGEIKPIKEINPIKIHNIKFKKRHELNKKELEYQHKVFYSL